MQPWGPPISGHRHGLGCVVGQVWVRSVGPPANAAWVARSIRPVSPYAGFKHGFHRNLLLPGSVAFRQENFPQVEDVSALHVDLKQ